MLQLKNIYKNYGTLPVLRGCSLEVSEGEIVTILGPSGAGKSTLLNIAGTLDTADSGEIIYDGKDLTQMKRRQIDDFRCRNLGFIFQFHELMPEFTALENVALPALIAGKSRKESNAEAEGLLRVLGLGGRLSHKPGQLSGGEKQRTAIARALVNRPRLVLADEPTGSLDSHNREELYRLFLELRERTGKTFIIVTHDESLALSSDRVIRMADGRIVGDSAAV